MAKQLGHTFGDEVIAAGLGGKPIAWGETDDTIKGRDQLTTAENATLDSVVAAHNSGKKQLLSSSDFIGRFTNQEYLLLEQKRRDDVANGKIGNAKKWDIVVAWDQIDIYRQKAQTLKEDLVKDGILTQARADEIFS